MNQHGLTVVGHGAYQAVVVAEQIILESLHGLVAQRRVADEEQRPKPSNRCEHVGPMTMADDPPVGCGDGYRHAYNVRRCA